MGDEHFFVEILQKCIGVERKAVELYSKFSGHSEDAELRAFWKRMSDEEKSHVGHWTYLLNLARDGVIPNIFESLHHIEEQVDDIHSRIDPILAMNSHRVDTTSAFTAACHLEFYMLNKEFSYLFSFMRNVLEETSEEDDYDQHLERFFAGLDRFCDSPELKLLAQTINRVFIENRDLMLQSHTDPLTGLLNKRGLIHTITPLAHLALRKGGSVAVLMADVDGFKAVNDSYGHPAGDEVLLKVAQSLRAHTRRSDLVARYGGDEFLVYLSEVDESSLNDVAEKIRYYIEKETKDNTPVTVSIGAAQTTFDSDVNTEIEDLIKNADLCLYRAKQKKNFVIIMQGAEIPVP